MALTQDPRAVRSINIGASTDAVLSPDGATIFVAQNTRVTAFSTSTGAQVGSWTFGTKLGAIDVSPDGKYLVATEQQAGSVTQGGLGSFTTDYNVYRLSLESGAVQTYTNRASSGDAQFWDVSFLSDGRALLTQHYNGSGFEPLTTLNFDTGSFSRSQRVYSQDGVLTASPDRSHIAFLPQNISDAPVFVYTAGLGVTASHENYADNVQGYNRGVQAISPSGNLIAQGVGLNIYNGALHLLTSLATRYPELTGASGLAFSPSGDKLYLLDPTAREVFILATSTWDVVGGYPVGTSVPAAGGSFGNALQISSDGRYLSVIGSSSIQILDLTKIVSDAGTSGADTLIGTDEADVIYGFAGNDVIDGKLGADTIRAGAGDDTISFSSLLTSDTALGAGSLDGGVGYDTLDFSHVSPATFSGTSATVGKQSYSVSNFELVLFGPGDDKINLLQSGSNLTELRMGGGNDTISVAGAYVVKGEAGDDTFILSSTSGLSGSIDGGAGVNTLQVSGGFTVDLAAGTVQSGSLTPPFSLSNIQNVIVTVVGASLLIKGDDNTNVFSVSPTGDSGSIGVNFDGRGGNDTLSGSAAGDILSGGAGDDILRGGGGSDRLTGGSGADTFIYSGSDSVVGAADVITDFETGVDKLDLSAINLVTTSLMRSGGNTVVSAQGASGPLTQILVNGTTIQGGDLVLFTGRGVGMVGQDGVNDLLIGSAGPDTLGGNGGDDILQGRGGDDVLTGGLGNDVIDGGAGLDTAVFAQAFAVSTVRASASGEVTVGGADGVDVLTGIERYQFSDGTVVKTSASPLVDAFYYDARYADVFRAGLDVDASYAGDGWRAGRDPNAYFSTAGYLGLYGDVKAAAIDPLAHYDQFGWREGRDPSANFDTRLYLIHNPDVAAAGLDPLAHYLQYGQFEGRQAYRAIGDAVSAGGFDAGFYLLANPDVAAAGVDPYLHYLQYGWREGRDPNAWFDVRGYLAAYADVARAGIDPLAHYDQFGWREGRDPSAHFDTRDYLQAYADVAAAKIDPLVHFLQNGAYESRSTFDDGVFG